MKGTGLKVDPARRRAGLRERCDQACEAAPAALAVVSGMLPWPKVDFSKFGEIEEVELGRIQKISGADLNRNWVMIPHVTHFDETDITELEAFRKQQNEEAAKQKLDVKITPVVFILKAVASSGADPRFNSSLSKTAASDPEEVHPHRCGGGYPNGLVVPVFRTSTRKASSSCLAS
ncbi:2-oxo acid dehydrogenase subunit E2 [Shigella flexneri]